jgi:hypothetical protein
MNLPSKPAVPSQMPQDRPVDDCIYRRPPTDSKAHWLPRGLGRFKLTFGVDPKDLALRLPLVGSIGFGATVASTLH